MSERQAEPFVSYAQNCEDVMLYRALGDVQGGFYIDVGAAEPEAESVTRAFYLRGWRGINLEPAPGAFERLSQARPNDINLNIGAGDRDQIATFFLVDGGNGLSTADPSQRERLLRQGWDSTETRITVRTLASVAAEHVDGPVHFLKIDVEGGERSVLSGMDFSKLRPWIILVESTLPNSPEESYEDWEFILLNSGYIFVWFDGLNRFYVAKERLDLKRHFNVQPNVFDNFVKSNEVALEEKMKAAQMEVDQVKNELAAVVEREGNLNSALEDCRGELEVCRSDLEVSRILLAERDQKIGELQAEVDHLSKEREFYAQELFESNRHAASLARSQQELLMEIAEYRKKAKRRRSRRRKLLQPMRALGKMMGIAR